MRTILLIATLTLCAGAAQAQALPSTWLADATTGCKVWDPAPEPDEAVRWSGACEGGYASGPGVTEWMEHGLVTERTEGTRVAGHLQGAGKQASANGDRFEGMWKDDRKEGYGAYTAASGASYVGDFKDDKFDGHGVLTDPRGATYDGAWKAGRRNGQGTFKGVDGSSYTGLWIDDEPAGGPQTAL
jgi:hypothetical protein